LKIGLLFGSIQAKLQLRERGLDRQIMPSVRTLLKQKTFAEFIRPARWGATALYAKSFWVNRQIGRDRMIYATGIAPEA
jgi:hypothetical protein